MNTTSTIKESAAKIRSRYHDDPGFHGVRTSSFITLEVTSRSLYDRIKSDFPAWVTDEGFPIVIETLPLTTVTHTHMTKSPTLAISQLNHRYGSSEGYAGASFAAGILEISVSSSMLYYQIREDFAEECWMFEGFPVAVNMVYTKAD